ncbi:hypothetical protein AWRI1631_44170 [Saccharomyces cerevisiae AWRI1631]|uniref:Uncharacterized protein n=1 Tax=Saccharomyces cerevisiae (strain AWRI1631) TaxID=545124 RepID=B5VG88_YEAS6|nr:hypothetical protein AWRI1631_44170 [Saccharomyces cerevisiae AWRI1631]
MILEATVDASGLTLKSTSIDRLVPSLVISASSLFRYLENDSFFLEEVGRDSVDLTSFLLNKPDFNFFIEEVDAVGDGEEFLSSLLSKGEGFNLVFILTFDLSFSFSFSFSESFIFAFELANFFLRLAFVPVLFEPFWKPNVSNNFI